MSYYIIIIVNIIISNNSSSSNVFIIIIFIILPSMLRSSKWAVSSGFLTKTSEGNFVAYACCMFRQSHHLDSVGKVTRLLVERPRSQGSILGLRVR
jgi:hypothetical protein